MWWLLTALAQTPTCEGDPVQVGRIPYSYREESGCGNGRWAECIADHVVGRPPSCDGATLHEQFGGGTSTRFATIRGDDASARRWLLTKVGGVPRDESASDLLAHDPPTRSAADGAVPRTAQATRWVAGVPATPRISWAEQPCPDDAPSDTTCLRIFRGDQVKPARVDRIDASTSLHVYANDWRNRRVFLVLHDEGGQRHTLVAKHMIPTGDLPTVVDRHEGLVLAHQDMDAVTLYTWVRPDGSTTVVPLAGGTVVAGEGWKHSKTEQIHPWSEVFAHGVPGAHEAY